MKLLGTRQLSVLLVGTLLLCYGAFGALHLVCDLPKCAGGAEHAAEHQPAAGATGDAHEHPVGHGTSTEYFAVVVGLLGLLLRLLPKGTPLRIGLDIRWASVPRRVPAVFRPPPTPHSTSSRCSGSERLFAPITREQRTLPETPHK